MDDLNGVLSPQLQGILSGAFSGMQASGPSRMPTSLGQVIGAGGQSALGGYNSALNAQRQYSQSEALIGLEKQKAAMTAAQVAQAQWQIAKQNWALNGGIGAPPPPPSLSGVLSTGGGMGGALSAPTQGATMGAVLSPNPPMAQDNTPGISGALSGATQTPTPPTAGGLFDGMEPWRRKSILATEAGFPELGKQIDKQNEPFNVQGVGMMVRDPNDPTKLILAPGQLEGLTALERAKKQATEDVTNQNTLVDRQDPTTGQKYQIPKTEAIRLAQPQNAMQNLAPDVQAAIRADMAKSGTTDANIAFKTPNGFVRGTTTSQPPAATGPTAQREKYNTDAATNFGKYEQELNDRVGQGQNLMLRLDEEKQALANFKPGAGRETYANIAKVAQALGASQDTVDKIAGGNLGSIQEFTKLSAQTAMEQLKQAMTGAGRITQMEFKIFQQNNPNIETDPRAIDKIFDFTQKLYSRDRQEQQFVGRYKQDPNADLSNAQNAWAAEAEKRGLVPGANKTTNTQPANTFQELPPANQFKGKRIRDTVTNKVMQSDGMTWKEAK